VSVVYSISINRCSRKGKSGGTPRLGAKKGRQARSVIYGSERGARRNRRRAGKGGGRKKKRIPRDRHRYLCALPRSRRVRRGRKEEKEKEDATFIAPDLEKKEKVAWEELPPASNPARKKRKNPPAPLGPRQQIRGKKKEKGGVPCARGGQSSSLSSPEEGEKKGEGPSSTACYELAQPPGKREEDARARSRTPIAFSYQRGRRGSRNVSRRRGTRKGGPRQQSSLLFSMPVPPKNEGSAVSRGEGKKGKKGLVPGAFIFPPGKSVGKWGHPFRLRRRERRGKKKNGLQSLTSSYL